jgi:hypothetical protein
VRTHPGIEEQLHYILETALALIQIIFGIPGTEQPPGNFDVVILDGKHAAVVLDGEVYLRHPRGFESFGTAEYDLLHFGAAKHAGTLFTEYPSYGIEYIGFPATVRTDHTSNTAVKFQHCSFGKRFESVYFQARK